MLINCSECGKEVSDKAKTCPNCGCPIKGIIPKEQKEKKHLSRKEKKHITIACIIGGIILLIFAGLLIEAKINDYINQKKLNEALYGNGGTPITSIADAFEDWANSH